VDYQPISDAAQLQMVEHLLSVVLQGILLVIVVTSGCLLGLCLAELRLPRRRPADVQELERRASGAPMPEMGRSEPGSFVIRHSPSAGECVLRSDIR
jgi:hypothetical protein